MSKEKQNLIIYTSKDGLTKIDVTMLEENLWITIEQMAELFDKSRSTINEHILNIYAENELEEGSTMRKIGNSDFSTKPTNFYNLDMFIALGYRIQSQIGLPLRNGVECE